MSFGENLQFLRKKNNITQEQLAERLGVSRQSVSKWESEGNYPEMDKLLQLCEMFSCSMDALMRGSVEESVMEDTAHYDAHMNDFSRWISGAIGFFIFSLGLQCLFEEFQIGEEICNFVFWVCLAASVIVWIVKGMQHDLFQKKNPRINQFYTEDVLDKFERRFLWMVAVPIGMIILDFACNPLLEKIFMSRGFTDELSGAFFLWILAAAVTMLVYGGMQKAKYKIEEYNQENEYNTERGEEILAAKRKIGKWCGVIMLCAVILFILCICLSTGAYADGVESFKWKKSIMMYCWVPFPIGGILCGIVSIILNPSKKSKA